MKRSEKMKITKEQIEKLLFENYNDVEIIEIYNENCIEYDSEKVYLLLEEYVEEVVLNRDIIDVIDDLVDIIRYSKIEGSYYAYYKCENSEMKGFDDINEAIDVEKLVDYLYEQQ